MDITEIKKRKHDLISDLNAIFNSMEIIKESQGISEEALGIIDLIQEKEEQVFINSKLLSELAETSFNTNPVNYD